MTDHISIENLFELKAVFEAQFQADYVNETALERDNPFEFLIGEWDLVRTSFDHAGKTANRTNGSVVASYTFGGRVIQEDFDNYLSNGVTCRSGTALYTYSPTTREWTVAAVDAAVGATTYSPKWINGEVHYDSVVQVPSGEVAYTRSRIFNIGRDSYEWEQEASVDKHKWYRAYHILNTRRQ